MSCFSVPVREEADGAKSRHHRGGNSVGVHGPLGSLAGTEGRFFRGRVTTFLCLSPLGSLWVRPNLFLFVFTVLAQGETLLSVLSNEWGHLGLGVQWALRPDLQRQNPASPCAEEN